jgi:hypothetical protein
MKNKTTPALNIEQLHKGRDCYEKVRFTSGDFDKVKDGVLKFFDIASVWEKEVSTLNDFNIDVQVWVFDDFSEIQLVANKVINEGETRDNYFHVKEQSTAHNLVVGKELQSDDQLKEWKWTCFDNLHYQFELIDELSSSEIDELLNDGYSESIFKPGTVDEQRLFTKRINCVWVGRSK